MHTRQHLKFEFRLFFLGGGGESLGWKSNEAPIPPLTKKTLFLKHALCCWNLEISAANGVQDEKRTNLMPTVNTAE